MNRAASVIRNGVDRIVETPVISKHNLSSLPEDNFSLKFSPSRIHFGAVGFDHRDFSSAFPIN